MKQTFKIGDKVKRIKQEQTGWWADRCNKNGYSPDQIFTIKNIRGSYPVVDIEELEFSLCSFNADRFELAQLTPEQEYEEAKKLIGKTILVKGTTLKYKVYNVVIRRDNDKAGISGSCISFLEKHGYVVAMLGDNFSRPFPDVVEYNKEINVKLNDKYDAIVTKDGITVGSQTFSHDIVDKLKNAIEEINK
jgi:hypothetical protein